MDPDSEIITATEVTAGDASVAERLLQDVMASRTVTVGAQPDAAPSPAGVATPPTPSGQALARATEVYWDASYGTAERVEKVEAAGIEANLKVQPPSPRVGMFSQDDFAIDTQTGTVTGPRGLLVVLRAMRDGSQLAEFGEQRGPHRGRLTPVG